MAGPSRMVRGTHSPKSPASGAASIVVVLRGKNWNACASPRVRIYFARLPRGRSGRPRILGVLAGRVFEIAAPQQRNTLWLRRDLFRSVICLNRNHSWPERGDHQGSPSPIHPVSKAHQIWSRVHRSHRLYNRRIQWDYADRAETRIGQ